MFILPNGKKIDTEAVATAMENSDISNHYFLDSETGDVELVSEMFDNHTDKKLEASDKETDRYFKIPHIPSYEQYEWMAAFTREIVSYEDKMLAEKLEIALNGKGAFRRFNDILLEEGNAWIDGWNQWKSDYVYGEMEGWLATLLLDIKEDLELDDNCPLCQEFKKGETQFQSNQRLLRSAREAMSQKNHE